VIGQRGDGAFGPSDPLTSTLLVLGGAVTAAPLVLFTLGARALAILTWDLRRRVALPEEGRT
jgi:EamA domain-containing membrane protein RarD